MDTARQQGDRCDQRQLDNHRQWQLPGRRVSEPGPGRHQDGRERWNVREQSDPGELGLLIAA